MGELLQLQNYLANVRDDLEKQHHNSFASNVTTAIGILMDYRTDRPLNNHSIEKIIQYAGVLNLILIEAESIANRINKAVESTETKQLDSDQLEKDLANLAFKIGQLVIDNPQLNNDMDFLKTIYNRQLDNNLNKRGVIGHSSNCNCAYCNKRKEK
jgi:hypothetical protein